MRKDFYLVTLAGVEPEMKVLCIKKTDIGNIIETMRSFGGRYIHISKGFHFEDVFEHKQIYSDTVRDETISGYGTVPNERAEGHLSYKIDSEYIPDQDELAKYLEEVLGTDEKRDAYRLRLNTIENNAILRKNAKAQQAANNQQRIEDITRQ